MVNTWFVMIPPDYQNQPDSEKELVDFRVQYQAGSKAWNDANAGRIVRGAEGETGNPQISEDLIKWKGPFSTEAQAKAAQNPQQQSPNPLTDAGNALQTSTANPLNFLYNIADFFKRLTEPETWVRIGEFAVGGMLLYVGIKAAMSGTAAGETAKSATKPAKKAVSIGASLTPTARAARTITRTEKKAVSAATRHKAAQIRSGSYDLRNGKIVYRGER